MWTTASDVWVSLLVTLSHGRKRTWVPKQELSARVGRRFLPDRLEELVEAERFYGSGAPVLIERRAGQSGLEYRLTTAGREAVAHLSDALCDWLGT